MLQFKVLQIGKADEWYILHVQHTGVQDLYSASNALPGVCQWHYLCNIFFSVNYFSRSLTVQSDEGIYCEPQLHKMTLAYCVFHCFTGITFDHLTN